MMHYTLNKNHIKHVNALFGRYKEYVAKYIAVTSLHKLVFPYLGYPYLCLLNLILAFLIIYTISALFKSLSFIKIFSNISGLENVIVV